MSEEDWGDIEQTDAKPSRFPKWLLFCGGGCLVMVVLLIVAGIFLWDRVKDAGNPDVQYPKFEEHLALDHRLEDVQLQGFEIRGQETYSFVAEDQSFNAVFLTHSDPKRKQELDALLDPESEGSGVQDAEVGSLVVQGRELAVLRGRQQMKVPLLGEVPGSGPVMIVDLAQPDSDTALVLMYICPGRDEPVSDQEVIDFLAPFHVGPDRTPVEPPREDSASGEEELREPSEADGEQEESEDE